MGKKERQRELEEANEKKERVSSIVSNLYSDDNNKRNVAFKIVNTVLNQPTHALHNEMKNSREIVFALEKSLCVVDEVQANEIIATVADLIKKYRNTTGLFELFFAFFIASRPCDADPVVRDNIGIIVAKLKKEHRTAITAISIKNRFNWKTNMNALGLKILLAMKEASDELLFLLGNVNYTLHFVLYCMSYHDNPDAFSFADLTPSAPDSLAKNSGIKFITDLFMKNPSPIFRDITLRALELHYRRFIPEQNFAQEIRNCANSQDARLASTARDFIDQWPKSMQPQDETTNKITKFLREDDSPQLYDSDLSVEKINEFIKLGGMQDLISYVCTSPTCFDAADICRSVRKVAKDKFEAYRDIITPALQKRFRDCLKSLNPDDFQAHTRFIDLFKACRIDVADALDDECLTILRARSDKNILILHSMPAPAVAKIVQSPSQIQRIIDDIVTAKYADDTVTNILVLIDILQFHLSNFFSGNSVNVATSKLKFFASHPYINKLLPHLHQLLTKEKTRQYEGEKKAFSETHTDRMLLLALLALVNHSARAYAVERDLVKAFPRLGDRGTTEKDFGLVLRSIAMIGLSFSSELVASKWVEALIAYISELSTKILAPVFRTIISTLWLVVYLNPFSLSPSISADILDTMRQICSFTGGDYDIPRYCQAAQEMLVKRLQLGKKKKKFGKLITAPQHTAVCSLTEVLECMFQQLFVIVYSISDPDELELAYLNLPQLIEFININSIENLSHETILLDLLWWGIFTRSPDTNSAAILTLHQLVENWTHDPWPPKLFTLVVGLQERKTLHHEYAEMIDDFLEVGKLKKSKNFSQNSSDTKKCIHLQDIEKEKIRGVRLPQNTKEYSRIVEKYKLVTRNLKFKQIEKEQKRAEMDTHVKDLEDKAKKYEKLARHMQQKQNQLDKLREIINCPICMERQKDTAFSPCNHSLCGKCATAIIESNQNENRNGRCPICRVDVESLYRIYL